MNMQFINDIFGQGTAIVRDIAVADGALIEGALLMAGATTVNATAVVAAAPYTNVIGRINEASETSSGTVAAGTFEYKKVTINPGAVYRAQFSQTTGNTAIAVTSGSTTTNFKFAASDDDFEGGYLYIATGTGIGGLWYCDEATTTDLSTLSTMPVAPDVTSYSVKIPGGFCATNAGTTSKHGFLDLSATAIEAVSKVKVTGKFGILGVYIKYDGSPLTELQRAKHDGLIGLNSKNVNFYIDIIALSHAFNSYMS